MGGEGVTFSKKILVVEDEFLVAMMIADMLTDLGHDVIGTAMNLAAAVQKSLSLPVDFAILDVNLNGELSYPAADALAARGIPFVFATGYSSKGLQEQYKGVPRLQKPFDLKTLEKAVIELATK
jgi:CheY-like chemotaxis protein